MVIGNGNVALDVARVLVKSAAEMATSDLPDYAGRAIRASGIEDVYIVGRRGAAYAKWTTAELREIGALADCEPVVDAGTCSRRVNSPTSAIGASARRT